MVTILRNLFPDHSVKLGQPFSSDSLIIKLAFFLRLLQVLGMFPLELAKDENGQFVLKSRFLSAPLIWGWTIQLLCLVTDGRYLVMFRRDIFEQYDTLKTLKALALVLHGSYVYITGFYLLIKACHLKELLVEWDLIVGKLKYTKVDHNIKRFSLIVSVLILLFGIVEHVVFNYTIAFTNLPYVGPYDAVYFIQSNDSSLLAMRNFHQIYNFEVSLPYSLVLVILKVVIQAIKAFVWSFIDVFMILLFRSLSFRFKALAEIALDSVEDCKMTRNFTTLWEEIRYDYEELNGILKKLNAFFSLPLLLSYLSNVVLMSMHLSQWLFSKGIKSGHGMPTYASLTSRLIILRLCLITYYGSEIHENAYRVLDAIGKCPSTVYSVSMERLERKLATQRIGLNAGGVFFISRNLFASIASVMFTIEIFLLQASQPTQT